MKKDDIEKSLKRFLKRKVSYSTSILIAFIITGGISLGAGITTEEINENKKNLLTKIQIEKEEIKKKIIENEKLINSYNSEFIELLRKGNFYSKGLFPSTQIFFPITYEHNGKGKNRTEKEFKETIEAAEKFYSKNTTLNKLEFGNGFIVNTEVFKETIDVGANIKPIEPKLPSINPNISINILSPTVNLGILPETISPTITKIPEVKVPKVEIPSAPTALSISISLTQNNQIAITAPTIEIPTLITPTVNIKPVIVDVALNVKTPNSIITTNPKEPERVLNIVEPDAKPFSDFSWGWLGPSAPTANTDENSDSQYALGDNIDVTSGTFWSGVKPDNSGTIFNGAGYTGAKQATAAAGFDGSRNYSSRHLSIINSYHGRWTGKAGNTITGGVFYVAGDVNGISYSPYAKGTEAFHLVGDVHLENVTANLYGMAAFINAEAFRGGQTTMKNVTINVLRDENTVFHLKGSRPGQEDASFVGSEYATKFAGNANITVDTKKNSIYAVRNFAGGLKIENTGNVVFNGASNIGFSFLTWVPDKSKYIGKTGAGTLGEGSIEAYVPYVKLTSSAPMGMYGDENVGIFFNKKISAYDVGIHQGYFELYFDIGTKLNSNGGTVQKESGQLGKDGYTPTTVDGNVGVYAISGQRVGVNVTKLAPQKTYFQNDPIHNLIMDQFDIKFGKYSKNGFMFLAKNGTVIEIEGVKTTDFSDGVNGTNTLEADAGLGTIIAYAEGKWTAAETGLASLTGSNLENKSTEIIVNKKLNMMSKEGIAFFAKNDGKVTVKKDAEGYGYGSIIGYADNGSIDVNANIVAVDNGVASEDKKYNNIGGYAIANGTITVTGNAEINGLGAFTNGINAKVLLKGTNNIIRTGVDGGLASLKGGYIEFGGGIIEHKDIKVGDHNQKLPFFADDTSKINFTGTTEIKMYDGAVFTGNSNDYANAVGTSAKYNGMGNVTISLQKNGINLGVFKNQNIIWNGEAGYLASLASVPKVASILDNGYWYNSYLEGGTMTIATNVNMDNGSSENIKGTDVFSDIVMEREKVTINPGVQIISDKGRGLVLGSNVVANTNGKNDASGYTNNGEIKIKGGNEAGVHVSYGHIKNNNFIETDGGIGALGVNGSRIENTNTGKINIGTSDTVNGVGIVGLATKIKGDGTPDTPESYGTDAGDAVTKVLEIYNRGSIVVKGKSGVGIYAENNGTSVGKERTFVENTGSIIVGDSTISNAAVGIYGDKTTISNQGNITVGDEGVGIYAKNGTEVTNLGTLNLGTDGIGIVIDGTSTITANSVTLASTEADINGKTGIFYKGSAAGTDSKNINLNINASDFVKGTTIYAENMNITSSGDLNIGKEGIGIFVKGSSSNIGTNSGTINLTSGKTGAVGMYTKTANILNNTGGIINVNDSSQIGMYAEGNNNSAVNTGVINLKVDGSTGIYVKSGAVAELGAGNDIEFDGESSVGVFAENARVNFGSNLTFRNNNTNKNIYVYGKDSTVEIGAGITVTVDGATTPTISGTEGNKTVGIYIENTGTGSTFNGTGNLEVLNGAAGIYSKRNNTLNVNVTATGDKTTGVFIDGASTVSGTVAAKTDAIGVYGSGGTVTIGTMGLILNTNSGKGTGMYLVDGAYAAGGLITVNNTSGTENIGVYYSKGTGSGTITNSADIKLTGTKSIGIYTADGINLVNTKNIESSTSNNIASYVDENSILASTGNITMSGLDNIGIYVGEGKGVNGGVIDVSGATGTSSAGMVAKTDATGDAASIENTGEIKAGANLGMYIAGSGTSSGKNTGSITVSGTGTGVYVDGSGNSFNGAGGSITSDAVGIYLKDTTAGTITNTGTLNIASGGVGVFGENANIDFTVNVSEAGAVGVVAAGTSAISGNIKTGQGSVGAFLLNDTVTFNGAVIETGVSIPESHLGAGNEQTSIGILLNAAGTYSLSDVSVNAKNGVGIYLEDSTKSGSGVKVLKHNGVVTTEDGVGIYVNKGNSLTTENSTININKGTGIYVNGGTANLGITGNLSFNFLANGGIGVFNNGGILNFGNNITVTGSGTLTASANGSLNSTGNLNIGEGATGMLGTYDSAMTGAQSIINTGGTITIVSGGIGLAAVKGTTNPAFPVTINNTGTINASGVSIASTPSIGIYTDIADVVNTGSINVGSNGIGIYSANNGILTSVQNNNMTMTGTDGIGVYIKGSTAGLAVNNITSTGSRNTGVVLEGTAGNINIGTVILGNESVGTFVTGAATSIIDGTITVGNGSTSKSAIGVVTQNGANMTLAGTAVITTGAKGIGVYAQGAGTTITVSNTANITVGTEGIYMYSKDATLNFSGNITANDQIGIVAEGGTINAMGASTITVQNGGIGAYVKGAAPVFGTTTITVQTGTSSKYSMGVYYDGVAALGTAPVITQTGNYTIGMVLNNSTGTTAGGISIGGLGTADQVGIMAKGNSNLTVAGTVSINRGDNNIGVYGEDSIITVNGNVTVEDSSSGINKSTSSIGVSLNRGSYIGSGNITAGDYSIGVFGKEMTAGSVITQGTGAQTMTVGKEGLGIYGEGTGGTISANMSNITVGTDNAIGVYAIGMNSMVKGNMSIGTNTSIGIASEGNGNVTYTGAMTIANKVSTASVGIYKTNGIGTISTSAGNWSVGDSGYGIFLNQSAGQSAAINNNADMNLGMSSVGIYSNGNNTVTNTGNIIVGATDLGPSSNHNKADEHLNSIGIYLLGGTTATSSGTITVNHDHSVGVYGEGTETRFTNTGTINVDNGAVGILVRDGAVAVNAVGGNINLGGSLAACGATTVGMAAYSGARIENAGTITVNEGVGMLVGNGATFANTGTIIVNNGIGIEGIGNTVNAGHIIVNGGVATEAGSLATAQIGAVEIKPDGTIKINGNYTSIGGTLSTGGNIIVDGAYVDVTTGTPLFNANSVSGEVNILPNFALTGNGISYEIEGFVNTAMETITGTKLTPVTSPLFIAKVTDKGNLIIVKRPYADITIGKQFDTLDKGLDNILTNSNGIGRDADILKNLNVYLNKFSGDQFGEEASRKLAEFRGDIYATIQERMQDINRAFDNSFYELESSYNLTKDSSKYSVIYTDGNYKDSTLGIDDYDYKVMGLLYMKEKEGTEYGSKYGYTLGFAGSKFDFDDGGSKEDVYSLRIGAHRVKNLSDEYKVSWLSRIELGYNRHIAKRKLNLQETFENKGEYNTYSVALDNRLTKVIYTDLSRQLDVYADLDLEYGKIDDFKESAGSKGGLEVQIKDNDYLSAQAGAGVKTSQRIYAGNDISVKVTADVKYAYEFGDNYDGNKAKLKNGEEGYYSLITPEEREGKLTGKIGLTVEKANHMGVTFEVEAADESNKEDSSIKYGVRFNYKF